MIESPAPAEFSQAGWCLGSGLTQRKPEVAGKEWVPEHHDRSLPFGVKSQLAQTPSTRPSQRPKSLFPPSAESSRLSRLLPHRPLLADGCPAPASRPAPARGPGGPSRNETDSRAGRSVRALCRT